ncbi:MAG TPA: AAA family ATPase [Symbiobacteriaceae bacterium]|nr:AAA family ATPase [Symbiobacteriaceae bacterium]
MTLTLAGRRQELARLRHRLADAAFGKGSLVLVAGEAGMGKTTLAEAAAAEAAEFATTFGRCPGPGETPPFGPWAEALHRAPGVCSEKAVAELLAKAGRPVLIILEDMQWADPASCGLLARVAERIATLPAVLLVTYDSDELHRKHPLFEHLSQLRQRAAECLQLRPFGPEELAELAGRSGGSAARAAGLGGAVSPLLATELLAEQNGIGPCATARELFAARLALLDQESRELLQAAAVSGPRFSRRLLSAMTGRPAAEVTADLRPAADYRLVRPDGNGSYEFVHPTAREAALEGLILPQRRRYHVQVADALLCMSAGTPFLIGLHLSLGGDPRAADYLMVAGDSARLAGALAQAEQLYEQALEWLPNPGPRRLCCLLKLCLTLRASGQSGRARICFEEANLLKVKG